MVLSSYDYSFYNTVRRHAFILLEMKIMLLNHSRYIAAGLHYQYTSISFPFRKHETRYFLPASDLLPLSGSPVVFTVIWATKASPLTQVFSGVIVAYTIATNVKTHRCSGHYLLMRIVPIVRIYVFGIFTYASSHNAAKDVYIRNCPTTLEWLFFTPNVFNTGAE